MALRCLPVSRVSDGAPGAVLVSLRHQDAVYKIDYATKDIAWKLGGTARPESLRVIGDRIHYLDNEVESDILVVYLHGLGLEVPLFTPTFAISRVSGWIAHALEQRRANRIIRPQSEYTGPRDLRWVPLAERTHSIAASL